MKKIVFNNPFFFNNFKKNLNSILSSNTRETSGGKKYYRKCSIFLEKNGSNIWKMINIEPKQYSGIWYLESGQGMGSTAMKKIIQHADQNNKTIALTPSADYGGNKNKLIKFYKQFGFVMNKGRNKNYETQELMVREPK